MGPFLFFINFASAIAIVAQLVERWLPKPKVASSRLVYRSWKDFRFWKSFLFYRLGKPRLVRWLAAVTPKL